MELYMNMEKHPITMKQAYQLAKAAEIIEWHDKVAWIDL